MTMAITVNITGMTRYIIVNVAAMTRYIKVNITAMTMYIILLIVKLIGMGGGMECALLLSDHVTKPTNHGLSHTETAALGQWLPCS